MQQSEEGWVPSLGREDPLEEGMANPLLYSCLENPMDKEPTAQGLHSWTWLKRFSTHRLNTCWFIIVLRQNQSLILISQFALWKLQFSPRFNLKPQSALSFIILRFQNFNTLHSMLIYPAYSLLPSNVLHALFKVSPLYFRQCYQLGRELHVFKLFPPNIPQILYLLPKHYMIFCICVLSPSSFLPSIHLNFYFLNVTSPASTTKSHC